MASRPAATSAGGRGNDDSLGIAQQPAAAVAPEGVVEQDEGLAGGRAIGHLGSIRRKRTGAAADARSFGRSRVRSRGRRSRFRRVSVPAAQLLRRSHVGRLDADDGTTAGRRVDRQVAEHLAALDPGPRHIGRHAGTRPRLGDGRRQAAAVPPRPPPPTLTVAPRPRRRTAPTVRMNGTSASGSQPPTSRPPPAPTG